MIKKLLIAALLSAAAVHAACAQAVLPPGYFWGNPKTTQAPPTSASPTEQFDRAFGVTPGSFVQRSVSGWVAGIMSGDCTITGAGAITCTKSNGVAFGGMAFQAPSAIAVTGGTITGLSNPSLPSDVANKSYVDSVAIGLTIMAPVRLATAAVLPNTPTYANGASGVGATLTAGSNAALVVDGTNAALNDNVLVTQQASAFQNGAYTVTTVGSGGAPWVLTRRTDFDTAGEMLKGSYFFVSAGATLINTSYVLQSTVTTVGTTAATFVQFSNANSGVSSLGGASGVLTLGSNLTIPGNVLTVNARPQALASFSYYVRKATGNDTACTGLVDAAYVSGAYPQACAFATWQVGVNAAAALDFNRKDITIQHSCSDGAQTFSQATITVPTLVGGGNLNILGCNTTNTTVFCGSGDVFDLIAVGSTQVHFNNMKLQQSGSGGGSGLINVIYNSTMILGAAMNLSTADSSHIYIHDRQASAFILGAAYVISGSAPSSHFFVTAGQLYFEASNVTVSGTPNFGSALITLVNGAYLQTTGSRFTGASTGPCISVNSNSVLNTFGTGGAIATFGVGSSLFFSCTGGATGTGGQYLP